MKKCRNCFTEFYSAVIIAGMKNTILSPEWVTDKFILIMLAVFPLWVGFDGYSNVTLSKFLFFVICTGLWLLLTAAGAIAHHKAPGISKGSLAVAALLLVACLSAALSPYREDTLIGAGRYDGLVSLALYCCIFMGVSAYGRPRLIYVWALAFSSAFCCVVALLQLLGGNPLSLFPSGWDYFDHGVKYSAEFLGNIGNVDVFAAFLCAAIPIMLGAYACSKRKSTALLLIPAALALFIELQSGVSSGKLGLAAAFIIGTLVVLRKDRLKRLIVCAAVVAAVVLLSMNTAFTESGVVFGSGARSAASQTESASTDNGSMASELKEMLHGHFEDTYGSGRIGIWRQLLEVYPQRPILGGGPGTVSDRIEIDYSRYVSETGQTLKTRVDNAHNEYLGYLMDEGALGFAAYMALIIMTLVRWIKRRSTPLAAIGCGMAGYWAQSFFGLGLCLVLPVIWLIWGLMWSREVKEYEGRHLRSADKRAS
jgi:O-antigen ligase